MLGRGGGGLDACGSRGPLWTLEKVCKVLYIRIHMCIQTCDIYTYV